MRNPVAIDNNYKPLNIINDESKMEKEKTYTKENVWQQIWGRMQMSSCFIFVKNSGFRRLCTYLNNNQIFNLIIIFCIIVSSILLVFDSPTQFSNNQWLKDIIQISDRIFTVVFIIEMIVKMVSQNVF